MKQKIDIYERMIILYMKDPDSVASIVDPEQSPLGTV